LKNHGRIEEWVRSDTDIHGMVIASQMADSDDDQVAQQWFSEHQRLPMHNPARCPMATGTTADDAGVGLDTRAFAALGDATSMPVTVRSPVTARR
jgi:hypothetical protein